MKLRLCFSSFFIVFFALDVFVCPAFPNDADGPVDNSSSSKVELHPDSWKKDGLPFLSYREKEAVSSIWRALDEEKDGAVFSDAPTGFIPLRRQSRFFRGKRVRLDGRLLRTVFHPAAEEKSDDSSAEKSDENTDEKSGEHGIESGYYETWVLLDDEDRIPARLLTRTIPDGFSPDTASAGESGEPRYRRERITAVGIYYRQTSYNAGDDFYNAPLVVAETFSLVSGAEPARSVKPAAIPARYYQYAAALTLVLLWILIRSGLKRRRKNEAASEKIMKDFVREPDDFHFPE